MMKKIKSLKNNNVLKKYFFNTSWMLADKLIRMGIILFINVLLARYLGPESFGFLAYSISLVAIFAIATHMGLSGLVVKELVSSPNTSGTIIGTVFTIKLLGALIGFFALLCLNFYTEEVNSLHFLVLLIISLSIFLKPFTVVNFWFTANVQSKYTAITSIMSIVIVSIFNILLVFIGMSLLWFAITNFIQALLIAIILIYFFYVKIKSSITKLIFSFEKAKYLLNKSWMIMLGAFFAIIYLKVDQIMLKWMLGNESVGIYSVASSLSEVWYFLPTLIVTSLFPKIIEMKDKKQINYNVRLQQFFDLLFLMAFLIAIFITFIADDVILFLYGNEYSQSGIILTIHIWAGVFIFMRALFSKWIIIEDILMFSLITQGFGALSNIVLNFILIPQYGVYGAAIATIVSYAIASYFVLFFYKKTKIIFWMMTKAILSPIRYPVQMIKDKL